MNLCKKCQGRRIKTRKNNSYGKMYSTPIECKDCGSTEFINLDKKDKWSNRRR
ncbi:MAG: hypothetical protein V1837_00915 [Candidatus Woesearchaeota archaeon]